MARGKGLKARTLGRQEARTRVLGSIWVGFLLGVSDFDVERRT